MGLFTNTKLQEFASMLQHTTILESIVDEVNKHLPGLSKAEGQLNTIVSTAVAAGITVPPAVTTALAGIASIKLALAPILPPQAAAPVAPPVAPVAPAGNESNGTPATNADGSNVAAPAAPSAVNAPAGSPQPAATAS